MKASIMIIDDDHIDRNLARRRLERSGRFAHVLEAPTAEEGLAMYRAYMAHRDADREGFPPLILLLDINMPGVDGFAFLEQFEKLGCGDVTRYVIMLSSSSAEEDRDRASRFANVVDYIEKPLSRDAVTAMVDRFVHAA